MLAPDAAWVSWLTTVIAGSSISATARSSKPTSATSWVSPRCCSAITAPSLITLRAANSAVGGRGRSSSRSMIAWPI